MNSPDFSRVDQLQSQVEPAAAHIIFVGTKAHFPDCLCRLVVAEIEGCSFSRLGSAAELVNMIEGQNARPQLIVIDDSLWAKLDEALLNTVHQDLRAMVAIAFRDPQPVARTLSRKPGLPRGISFLPMDLNIESWLTIIRLMLTGCPFVPPELLATAGAQPKPEPKSEPPPQDSGTANRLTRRESQVLALMAQGLQNKHIAEELALSEHTVKLHVHNVISKLGASNRTDAAMRYRPQ